MTEAADTEISGAPGELELIRQLVNTYDAEDDTDEFDSPAALGAWLSERRLADPDSPSVSPADVERVARMRESLRSLLLANNGAEPDPGALERLNEALHGATLQLRFEPGGSATLVPCADGVDGALARFAAIVREAMLSGEWQRLKVCPADDCLWAFYDRSRNRSRNWCRMEVCGNRAKVRSFRDRHTH